LIVDYRLSVFRTVAEQSSFTKASKLLHLSQPAVTNHIKTLEDELGHALLCRDSHGVSLTKAGAVLLRHAQQVARMDEAVTQEIRGTGGVVSGHLALGATSTIGQYLLPDWLILSRRRWPELVLKIEVSNTEEIIDAVLSGSLEIGLIEGRCRRIGLQAESFLDDEIICVASASNPLTRSASVPLATLKNQLWVFRERGSGTRDIAEIALKLHGLDPAKLNIDLELSSSEAIKAVVSGGHGLTFLSRFVIRRELAMGILRPVTIKHFSITRKLHLVYPRGPRPKGAAGAFANLVMQGEGLPVQSGNPAIILGYDI
jgi:DNA-binding transcriptional LysR family regulator